MTRILPAVVLVLVTCVLSACGRTDLVPGAPTTVSCALSVSPAAQAVPRAGGSFYTSVSGPCGWTAASDQSWIAVTNGQGANLGTVTYDVAANGSTAQRQGQIRIGDQTLAVTQAGLACSYAVQPASFAVEAAGGRFELAVSTAGECAWSASTNNSWIDLQTTSGTGAAAAVFIVSRNDGAARNGSIRLAERVVSIAQAAVNETPPPPPPAPDPPPTQPPPTPPPPPPPPPPPAACTYTLTATPARVAAAGGSVRLDVSTRSDCNWSAASPDAWLTVPPGQRSGTGFVTVTAGDNAVGTASISIAQDARAPVVCTYTLRPSRQSFDSSGGDLSIDVTVTNPDCAWSASSPDPWISVPPDRRAGNGRVNAGVRANEGGDRTGRIDIGSASVAITQSAPPCVSSVTPDGQRIPPEGGRYLVTVSARDGCTWTVSGPDWVLNLPRSGRGSMEFLFSVDRNPGGARDGAIMIDAFAVKLSQDAGR